MMINVARSFCYCVFIAVSVSAQFGWREIPASPVSTSRFDDIVFVNKDYGWIAGGNGVVYRTTNGGTTWTGTNSGKGYIRAIGFADTLKGWIGTFSLLRPLCSTTDGGITWSDVDLPGSDTAAAGVCGIYVLDSLHIFAVGQYSGPAQFIKTSDGGKSWSVFMLDSVAHGLVDCYFLNPDTGFAVGHIGTSVVSTKQSVILQTTDGGTTWMRIYVSDRYYTNAWKIFFVNGNVAYVASETYSQTILPYLARTIDSGKTWTSLPSPIDMQGVGFISPEHGWVSGWGSTFYETTDSGKTFTKLSFGNNTNRYRKLNDTLMVSVGQRMYKYERLPVVSVEQESTVPVRFSLHQNYPNPFNPVTRIEYTLHEPGKVVLEVYSIIGEYIATLTHDIRMAGTHTVDWNAANVSSGVYYYRLQTSFGVQTKKMIVIK
ncbi:MAG: T9SS type A sorting domain-containing protein [Bacteroidota bacterium]